METLEQLRRAVDARQDLQSIVRTMKVLAAVSIRQYERALVSLVDYDRAVAMGLQVVLGDAEETPVRRRRPSRRLGAIAFGSDHGLCGRFNDQLADFAVRAMERLPIARDHRHVLAVGSRMEDALEQRQQRTEGCLPVAGSAMGITPRVRSILLQVEKWRTGDHVTDVVLFYNAHRRNSPRESSLIHLLPVRTERLGARHGERWPSRSLPTYSMPRERLLASLIRQYLFVSVFRACAESLASEHASRLESMQLAEKNIEEQLDELELHYQQRRQEAITDELLDVMSGYEALILES